MTAAPLLRFEHARLAYGRRPVLEDVHFDVEPGAFLGVVGPNGSGKTTLLRAALGLLRPRAGRVTRPAVAARVGYVPQRLAIDPLFPLTVRDLVTMGRHARLGPLRPVRAADRRAVAEACERLGIGALQHRLYRDLSGGQQQRALLARALAVAPRLLVLDEPTNGMDLGAERAILDLIVDLHRSGTTVLLVTHLLHVVVDAATHLAFVQDGAVRVGPREELLAAPFLSALYGVAVQVDRVGSRIFVHARGSDAS